MRRLVRSLSWSLVLLISVAGTSTSFDTSGADVECGPGHIRDNIRQTCLVGAGGTPTVPGPTPGDPPNVPIDPEDPPTHCWDKALSRFVSCYMRPGWVWSFSWACHSRLMSPQPGPEHHAWPDDHDGSGAVYHCSRGVHLGDEFPEEDNPRWAPFPPWQAPTPDPEELVWDAIDSMDLEAVRIGIAPYDQPGYVGVVGLPVWMWAINPDPMTWGPNTASAGTSPYTVSATAQVTSVDWTMGDGASVTCTEPGTPYDTAYGVNPSPDCGHLYISDGTFPVTAVAHWQVTWEAWDGQAGVIEFDLERSTQVEISEVQSVIRDYAPPH